ncbi:MAG TPA: ABC transporter ATP-binding protein [Steroidobacteraceae bacterium]|nr:ABC transporter ATP-binding protein [Steroidobacteraceae bacterium]
MRLEDQRPPPVDPYVRIERVTKQFGGFTAVDDVSLEVHRGEVFCLLGGSGSGKTTLLRMLAGFEQPTSGAVYIEGQDMSRVPPYARPVNMMFQSYALFPHMSVERNVAFGLEQERLSRIEIQRRVGEMLELVKMSSLAARKPHQLSGGQRQRVALARALVKRPKLLLLDEPLAALDRKLREHTQFELLAIQEQLGVTFVVVTHDQQEAMTLATRMGVMSQGRIVQVGTPADIYERPATRVVADFIGNINLFEGRVIEAREPCGAGGVIRIACPELGEVEVCTSEDGRAPAPGDPLAGVPAGATVWVAIRPEKIELSTQPASNSESLNRVSGRVREVGYRGEASVVLVQIPSGRLVRVTRPNAGRDGVQRPTRDEAVSLSWHRTSPVVLTQ